MRACHAPAASAQPAYCGLCLAIASLHFRKCDAQCITMNQQLPPTPKKPVRTTITVDAGVLEVFQRLASVAGLSQSKAIGDFLADNVDSAAAMADLIEKVRHKPRLVAMELNGYALGLSDLTADLMEHVRGKGGAAGLTPPVGNTGGKLPRKPKK